MIRDRLGFRELPDWAADRLYTDVTVRFDWPDRLLVLVLGTYSIRVENTVEHAPGRHETVTRLRPPHLCWPWHRHMAVGVVDAPARGVPDGG